MATRSRCLVHESPTTIRLDAYDQRDLVEGEVRVEIELSAISPGTELRALAGRQDATKPRFIPGYSAVGRVIEGSGELVGRRIFAGGSTETGPFERMWGAHQSHAIVSARSVLPVPENVPAESAVLAKLAAISFHGTRHVANPAGKDVAVVGLGAIGQFSARCFAALGANVVAADRVSQRVNAARAAGVTAVLADRPLADVFAGHFPDGAHVVVDATGAPRVIAEAAQLARAEPWGEFSDARPIYLFQGSYIEDVPMPSRTAFMRELTFANPRDCGRLDLERVLALMSDGTLSTVDVLTKILSPEQAAEAYGRLKDPAGGEITFGFDWRK